jgi:hypothetical protein
MLVIVHASVHGSTEALEGLKAIGGEIGAFNCILRMWLAARHQHDWLEEAVLVLESTSTRTSASRKHGFDSGPAIIHTTTTNAVRMEYLRHPAAGFSIS